MAGTTARTWLPTLALIAHTLCVYMTRWDSRIREHLPEDAVAAYDALKEACDVFEAIIWPIIRSSEGS
jgi:hypothetical protein